MTRQEIKELRDDIASVVCDTFRKHEYSVKDQHLFMMDALYLRIYENVQDLLEGTLSGELLVCGPGVWSNKRCVPGSDACLRFFLIYDEQEAWSIDLSPYYLLNIGAELTELQKFIKIASIDRELLEKILEEGEC